MSESLRNIYVSEVITHAEANSSPVGQKALMSLRAESLVEAILKSNELRRVISIAGSTKLLETQAIRFRLSFTAEIVEAGSLSSEPTIT